MPEDPKSPPRSGGPPARRSWATPILGGLCAGAAVMLWTGGMRVGAVGLALMALGFLIMEIVRPRPS